MSASSEEIKVLSARRMAWMRFSANPVAIMGALMVASVILAAIFAPVIAPFPDHAGAVIDFRNKHAAPDATYLLGPTRSGATS
ncbi:hypothetical protein KU6B_34980 [Mameliella alba]|uniref:hypothetical protein n=1 Tax=Mameliella alba TaxID=561184 RepID=UPI0013E4693F|nr:hypothetical protein [Mameliella alba]BBU57233.1 hypothetical protein KU6B_34980 [Mameliella alba]